PQRIRLSARCRFSASVGVLGEACTCILRRWSRSISRLWDSVHLVGRRTCCLSRVNGVVPDAGALTKERVGKMFLAILELSCSVRVYRTPTRAWPAPDFGRTMVRHAVEFAYFYAGAGAFSTRLGAFRPRLT